MQESRYLGLFNQNKALLMRTLRCVPIKMQSQVLKTKQNKRAMKRDTSTRDNKKIVLKERKSEYHLDERKFIYKLISGN